MKRKVAKKVAVAFNKGGSGKTTTTTNLAGAYALRHSDEEVGLSDNDAQGNATSSFQIDKNNLEYTTYDILIGNVKDQEIVDKVVQPTILENLEIIPANNDLNYLEFDLMNIYTKTIKRNLYEFVQKYKKDPSSLFNMTEDMFENAIDSDVAIDSYYFDMIGDKLEVLEERYDIIFFDTPPELKATTSSVLAICDYVLIPFEPDPYSLEGLINIIRRINEIKKKYNPKLEIAGILATKVENRTKQHSDIIKDVVKFCAKNNINYFDTEIPKSIRFGSAISYEGLPATVVNKDNKFVKAYYDLFDELEEMKIL